MDFIEVTDFDGFKRYSFDLLNGQLKKQKNDWRPEGWPAPGSADRAEMPSGIIKKLTFGPTVICYHLEGRSGTHKMFACGKTEVIDSSIEINFNEFLCFSFGYIRLKSIHFMFVDILWKKIFFPAWLSRSIDPTWDNLDREMDAWNFGKYLNKLAECF